jgi:hypothetical protein
VARTNALAFARSPPKALRPPPRLLLVRARSEILSDPSCVLRAAGSNYHIVGIRPAGILDPIRQPIRKVVLSAQVDKSPDG